MSPHTHTMIRATMPLPVAPRRRLPTLATALQVYAVGWGIAMLALVNL